MKQTFTPASRLKKIEVGTNQKWRRWGATFLFCFSLTHLAEAQSKIWDKTIGSNIIDNLGAAILTQDGGSLLAGTVSDYNLTNKTELVKLKADGSTHWRKIIAEGNLDVITEGNFNVATLLETADGGFLAGGNTYTGTTKRLDYQVRKFKNDGTLLWVKTYGRKYEDYLSTVQQTQDGGFILGGSSQTSADSNGRAIFDYWIMKLDANGNKIWEKAYGGTGNDRLISVVQTKDGGYILGGDSYSGVSGSKTEPNRDTVDHVGEPTSDLWIVKVKADGTQVWDKTYGGNYVEFLISVKQTPDGGYILGGNSYSEKSGNKTTAKGGPWLVKLNANGTKVWDKTFGEWEFNRLNWQNDYLSSLELTTDGSYLLGLNSSAGIGSFKSEDNRGYIDYWVLKLKADGTKLWDKTIGSNYDDALISVQQTKEGHYLLFGTSGSNIGFDKSADRIEDKYYSGQETPADYWVVKLDNNIRQNQAIAFPAIKDQSYTQQPVTLNAQASSGLPVTYQIISGPATVKGNKLTFTGPGEVTIKARQTGNATYNATEMAQSFVVTLANKQQDLSFGGSLTETLTTVLATPDGGYLAGGMSTSDATGTKSQAAKGKFDYWVVKTDKTGQKVWDKSFGGTESDHITAMVATPDGGYLLGGTSTSGISRDKSQIGKGKEDYWLVKINAQGIKQWDKSYGGPEKDSLATIIATPNGYLLGGTSASGITSDKSQAAKGATDYWILEIDATGKKLWDKTFGGTGKDYLAALLPTPDGYLVGGTSASGISGDKSQAKRSTRDYWVLRIRNDGTKIWEKTYGGLLYYNYDANGYSQLQGLAATPDGGFLLAGTSDALKGGERSEGRQGAEDIDYGGLFYISDYWVVKINGQGTKIWDNFYGAHENYYYNRGYSFLNNVVALPEGGYLLGGSTAGSGGDITDLGGGGNDYWLIKIDEQGKNIGNQKIGGTGNDQLSALALAADGSYLLGGTSGSGIGADKSTNSLGETDYWVVKLNTKIQPQEPNTTVQDMRFGGTGRDSFSSLIKTTDGGYLSGGYTFSGQSGDKSQGSQGKNDYWIVKSDKNGKKQWDKRFGGDNNDYFNNVIQTQDGGYLLAGSTYSGISGDKSEPSRGGRDYWIVKTDAQGKKQWDKRFGGSGNDELKQVLQLASGEYILAGYSSSPANGDKSQGSQGKNDYWLVKISAAGAKIWDKRYGGNLDDLLESITITATGGFILGGNSNSDKSGDKTQANWKRHGSNLKDFWLVRVDGAGNKIWDRRYGSTGDDVLTTVGWNREQSPQAEVDGDYYVAGYSRWWADGDKKKVGPGELDYWFLQIKSNGNLVRENTYGSGGDDILQSVVQTENGDYLLAGTTNAGREPGQGNGDYWILRINGAGVKQKEYTFGGSERDELRSIVLAEDGGFVLGGRSDSGVSGNRTQFSQGDTDYWLIKVGPESNPAAITREAAAANAVVVQNSDVPVQAYPNPFSERITIRFTLPETQKARVQVLDSQGREITTLFNEEAQAHKTYQLEWQAGKQVNGLYLLQLQTPTQQNTRKILRNR